VGLSFNIETPDSVLPNLYTTNETAVAAALWDVFDGGTTEGFDALTDMAGIWFVFRNDLPLATDVSIEDFWDGYVTDFPGNQATLQNITFDRGMEFFDICTPTSPSTLTVGASPTHYTLYPGTAPCTNPATITVDFNAASTSPHTVKTLNLTNGADTFLDVLEGACPGVTPVTGSPNDNGADTNDYSNCGVGANPACPANNDTNLASSITFTPSAAGPHCIIVSRSLLSPPSAGVYGSFYLEVTSP